MFKQLKVSFYKFIMYSPIILGIILVLYVWFIHVPYKSNLYYCNTSIFCARCDALLGTDAKFCPECSAAATDVAAIKTFAHCNFCSGNTVYKNEVPDFCQACGNNIAKAEDRLLKDFGYASIKDFRRALMFDNLKRLSSNKIFTTVIIILCTKLLFEFIIQLMTYLARKRILQERKDGYN